MRETAIICQTLNLLRGIWKGVEKEWQNHCRSLDITLTQQHILCILAFEESITISGLSDYALMHITTTTDVVNRLQRKGLVRVEACPYDGRAHLVSLTEEGRSTWRRSLACIDKFPLLAKVTELPPEERRLLMSTLFEWAAEIQGDEFCQWVSATGEKIGSMGTELRASS
ncbi:MAG: MarR family transcriptional regulator [Firmicutes bacterium]|nr:MarR family transcriptional regulator [Bacillota bacterium]